jgi:hypothetical protein
LPENNHLEQNLVVWTLCGGVRITADLALTASFAPVLMPGVKSTPWILAGVLASLLTVGLLRAASDPALANLPSPAIDIGKCCGPFNCEAYLEVAAALQALPEAQRVAQLRAWAEAKDLDQWALSEQVVSLCRMLFEPNPGQPFQPSSLVTPVFVGSLDDSSPDFGLVQTWPLAPITLVDGIPFSVVGEIYPRMTFKDLAFHRGIDVAMRQIFRPDAMAYLEYCLKETRWTSRRFSPATPEALNRALDQLLHQHIWPERLSEQQMEFFTDQVQPQATPLTLWITDADAEARTPDGKLITGRGVRNERSHSGGDQFKVIALEEKGRLSLTINFKVNGGTRPYRYTFTRQGTGEPLPANLAQGRGQEAIINPYSQEKFDLRCYQPDGGDRVADKLVDDLGAKWIGTGDRLLFTIEDAQGTTLTQILKVIGLGRFEARPPATDPLLQQVLSTAKEQK